MNEPIKILTEEEEIEHMNNCARNNVAADEAEQARKAEEAWRAITEREQCREAEKKAQLAQMEMKQKARQARRIAAMRIAAQIVCWILGAVALVSLTRIDAMAEWLLLAALTVWTGWNGYAVGRVAG